MELVVNQDLEPEPLVLRCNTKEGLMSSTYKAVANRNFQSATQPSLFGMRQGLKAIQYNTVNHVAVVLKLTVFMMVLVALF